jgi:hypothetical protein
MPFGHELREAGQQQLYEAPSDGGKAVVGRPPAQATHEASGGLGSRPVDALLQLEAPPYTQQE